MKNRKRVPVTLMAMALPLLMAPASRFIATTLHSLDMQRMTNVEYALLVPPSLLEIPSNAAIEQGQLLFPETFKPLKPKKRKPFFPAKTAMQESMRQETNGEWVKEIFNEKGKRVSKALFTAGGDVLNRWHFDPVEDRIVRYEENKYKEGKWISKRIAAWHYFPEGGFFKKNQLWDPQGNRKESFNEFVNEENIKYREDWYDIQGRLIAAKRWDPKTGEFAGYYQVKYLAKGWSRRIYLNENKRAVREILFTPQSKPFKVGPIGLGRER